MLKASDLLTYDDDELDSRLAESRRELFNLRFQLATGQLDNPARVPEVRRDIARVLTELRTREIAAAEALERGEQVYVSPELQAERAAARRARTAAAEAAAAAEAEAEGDAAAHTGADDAGFEGDEGEGELAEDDLSDGEVDDGAMPGDDDPDDGDGATAREGE